MSHRRGKLKQVTVPDIFNHGMTTHTHGSVHISNSISQPNSSESSVSGLSLRQTRKRGPTRNIGLLALRPGQRILVSFNEYGQVVNEIKGRRLKSYLGTLVRNQHNVPLQVKGWKSVPIDDKEKIWALVLLPPLFNMPKSQLQCYAEPVYCVGTDMLSRCTIPENSLERFTSVVAWSLSSTRPLIFGVVPFNPVLGETHHVSRGTLNVLLEQVSHHPPVSALHATDEKENIELIWCQHAVPKFYGASVEAEVKGNRQLIRLLKRGENYVMNSPSLLIRFLPVPSTVKIRCQQIH